MTDLGRGTVAAQTSRVPGRHGRHRPDLTTWRWQMTMDDDDRPEDGIVDRITDDETPAGDTPEVHDEVSPHDIPPGHPMREVIERRAGDRGETASGS